MLKKRTRVPAAGWMVTAALCALAACSNANTAADQAVPADLKAFWTEFRKAALAGDKEQIASMTRFPFKVRGIVESDPVVSHDRASFLKSWDKLLAENPGLTKDVTTMRRMIELKTEVAPREVMSPGLGARIGIFEFHKIKGAWFLTDAYVEQ